ncbi:hypothetical protein [Mucilaginibacter gossypii]|uniref:DUF4760 domain-containing protein n=2 Tax=Mucilaginibacter TaxID=423349 RepID=A0A1G8MQR1_9SPHI|nr:hypothetical protein [Mucilaginibacter gossypii]SDI70262.1 hypothetical protein SAMN05192573_12844 [Mucilaginibacter gossypii]
MTTVTIYAIFLTLIAGYINFRLKNKYYIDKSIYQFRQSKHELTMYMFENAETIDKTLYQELKDLLHVHNQSIDHFSKIHKKFFPIAKVVITNTIYSEAKFEKKITNSKTEEFKKSYAKGVYYSLETVPFFKMRLLYLLIKGILKLLVFIGLYRVKNWIKKLDLFKQAESKFDSSCMA